MSVITYYVARLQSRGERKVSILLARHLSIACSLTHCADAEGGNSSIISSVVV